MVGWSFFRRKEHVMINEIEVATTPEVPDGTPDRYGFCLSELPSGCHILLFATIRLIDAHRQWLGNHHFRTVWSGPLLLSEWQADALIALLKAQDALSMGGGYLNALQGILRAAFIQGWNSSVAAGANKPIDPIRTADV